MDKVCPPGYTKRRGYTRKYTQNIQNSGFTVRRNGKLYTVHPKGEDIIIPASCVKNKRKLSITLRKGDLIRYGYQYRLSDKLRHKALKKAIEAQSVLYVYKKLDAVVKLAKKSSPEVYPIFAKDREWVFNML